MAGHRQAVGDDLVWLDVERLVKATDKAKLYVFADGEQRWVPNSVIEDENDELIGVQKWWARSKGLESAW